jgi:hypothetical protein
MRDTALELAYCVPIRRLGQGQYVEWVVALKWSMDV